MHLLEFEVIFTPQFKRKNIMNELVRKIKEQIAVFTENADAQLAGNKAAGTRARKATLELEKMMKEFRKISVEESKK